MKIKLLAILLTASFWTSSCGSIPASVTLPLPPEQSYPKVTLEEVKCLPKEIIEKIKLRDDMKSKRINTLTEIIKSTH